MLDMPTTSDGNEKQTRTTQIRHGDSLADLIDRAALALGVDKSVFLRAAIAKEAQRVIDGSTRHVMTAEDVDAFENALDTPPARRALRAAKSYRHRVVHAD